MRDVFVKGLSALADADPRVMLITGDLGFRVLDEFSKKYPAQFLNVGVAEQNMAGIACGLAFEGHIVFTYSIGNFAALRCLEQLRNGAAYHELNVNPVCIGPGFTYGQLGASHHATEDMTIVRSIPGFDVLCPGDDWEAEQLPALIAARSNPSYVRLETQSGMIPAPHGAALDFGKARLLRRGQALTLAVTGGLSRVVCEAHDELLRQGVDTRVLHYHAVSPLDIQPLLSASEDTGGIVTIEEHTVSGGFGGAVAEELLERGARPRIFARLGIRTGFVRTIGSQQYLRAAHGLDAAGIVSSVNRLLTGELVSNLQSSAR